MARKSEYLHCEINGQTASFEFRRLTLAQEKAWRQWLQKTIVEESREMLRSFSTTTQENVLTNLTKSLSAGPCSLTGTEGATRLGMTDGLVQFLKMASSETCPDMPEESLYELVTDNYVRCAQIVESLHPMEKLIAAEKAKSDPK